MSKRNKKKAASVKIRRTKLSEITPSDENEKSRRITPNAFDALKKSIAQFGYVEPIVVNEKTMRIVGGHQRYRALLEEGIEEADIVLVNIENKDEEKALMLALNNPGMKGEFRAEVRDLLREITDCAPDIYDSLRLFEIEKNLSGKKDDIEVEKIDPDETKDKYPEMELRPYEHYDYIIVLARNIHDWNKLANVFGIEKVNAHPVPGKKRIGIGRCVSAEKVLQIIERKKNGDSTIPNRDPKPQTA